MSDAPFPLHVDVFLAGTGRLSPTDLGAYLRLLLELWKEDGYLPMNHAHLCRLTGITPKRWEPAWQALSCFFDVFDGRLSQKRVLFELNLRAQRARAGAEGGLAKAKQTSSKPLANVWQNPSKTLAKGSTALEPPLITSENYLSAGSVNSDSSTRQEKGGGGFEVPVSGSVSLSGPVSPGRTSQPPIRDDRQSDERAADVRAVFDRYRAYHLRAFPRPRPESKEWKAIQARIREGYTPADLCRAIDGYHVSPFHCGENDTGTKYLGLALIMRDGSHVAQGIELAAGPGPVVSEKERRNHRASQGVLERVKQLGFGSGK